MTTLEPLLSPKETARRLSITVQTLNKVVKTGGLPFIQVGKRRKYDPDDVERFKQNKRYG